MQKQGSDKLEELLKAQLGNAEQAVPELVWTAVEEELFPEKKRHFFIWWWFLLAELAAIAVIIPVKMEVSGKPAAAAYATHHVSEKDSAYLTVAANRNTPNKSKSDKQESKVEHVSVEKMKHRPTASTNEKTSRKTARSKGNGHSKISGNHTSAAEMHQAHQKVKPEGTIQSADSEGKSGHSSAAVSGEPGPLAVAVAENHRAENPKTVIGENPEAATHIQASDSASGSVDTLPLRNLLAPIASLIPGNPIQNPAKEGKPGPWRIGLNGGYDFFSQSVFADYLETGQLSHNSFQSQGYELSANISRKVLPWLSVELFGAFNRKKSGYVYDILIDRDTYFSKVMNGESLELSQISGSSPANCYYLRNATASYSLDSWLGGLNIDMETKLRNRLGLYGGIGGLGNISTAMHQLQTEKLIIQSPGKEQLSYLQLQAYCGLSWKLSDYLSWRLGATYRTQVLTNSNFLSNQHSLLLNTGISVQLKTRK